MQKLLVNLMPASTWTGVGAPKLIPHQHQHLAAPVAEPHQFSVRDNLIHSTVKDGLFREVSDVMLGPVEKAVLHQAMYNQSKKQAPEMRRCDDCNVIFNSQTQAEMHYKGKKHAKVMYLKRCREAKQNPPKMRTAYLCEAASQASQSNPSPELEDNKQTPIGISSENATTIDSPHSTTGNPTTNDPPTGTGFTNVLIGPKNPYEDINGLQNGSVSPESFTADSDNLNRSLVSGSTDPDSSDVESKTTDSGSPTFSDEDKLKLGIPQREPVVLPDPLPRYISKIEKPSILKESLRCSVCDIYVNSENQMRQHVNSLRHKNIEKGIPTPPKPAKEDKPKGKSEQFRCEVCRVTLNSDIQLLQHLSSQRHKNMLEGKPPKPRWTPYERTQHALLRSAAQLRFSLKTIPGGTSPLLLTSPVPNSAAALPVPGHPSLRHSVLAPQAPSHLKQMAYITPNGSILPAQEIVYIGAPAPIFQRTQQPQTAGQVLQPRFPGVHPELSQVINPNCVSLDPHALNWNQSPMV